MRVYFKENIPNEKGIKSFKCSQTCQHPNPKYIIFLTLDPNKKTKESNTIDIKKKKNQQLFDYLKKFKKVVK